MIGFTVCLDRYVNGPQSREWTLNAFSEAIRCGAVQCSVQMHNVIIHWGEENGPPPSFLPRICTWPGACPPSLPSPTVLNFFSTYLYRAPPTRPPSSQAAAVVVMYPPLVLIHCRRTVGMWSQCKFTHQIPVDVKAGLRLIEIRED